MAATSSEPQREREVQRYLQSWQVAQGSALAVAQNVGSIGAPNEHGADFKPKASGDKALTAFAQLAVLRLNVKRAMVSIIDSSSQTILTEATNNFRFAVQGPAGAGSNADDLWLGTSILSRPDAVCEHCLINTYTARDPDGRTHTAPGLVIPDCRLDPRFDTRPYVVSEPGVRFYAGVPIISRNGHKIGAYAVSDEQPREGLTVDELQFMQGVAQAVMEHLEWARDRVDRFKGERIVRGLASFIEGSSARDDDSAAARDDLSPRPPEMSLTAAKHGGHGASSRRGARPARASSPAQPQPEPSSASSMPAKDMPAKGTPAKGDRQRPDGMARMFHRAAEILRTSTLADGVALFGATATSAKQSSRPRRPNSSDDDEVSLNVTSGSEGVGLDSSDSDTSPAARPCKILAYSLADEKARADIEQGPALSLGTLEKYYSLFPKGKALSFTGEGVGVSSEDDSASDREPSRAGARRKVRMDHEELLKKIPGVKAVVFVPLYDYAEDRLAGGCFLWTSVTGRLMNLDEDLSYLRAFGNSIMSEVARINTQKNEAAKTTFIASMSHELRSPLHGILGAAEFFRDTPLTSYQSGLIASITTCGKTLLDTLNHVLDYSKINRLGRMQLRRSAKQNKLLKLSTDSLDSLNITAAVDLAVLVEEVVDATSAGHTFKGASEAPVLEERYLPTSSVDQSVSVLLDISCRPSWMVRTQPGAIRRIIMNLFGNALKYTTKGSVHVSLRGQQERDGSKIDVLLKVVDTGKGMSEEFQRNRLFVPFSQEDSFQPGTGLGLSIVKQIVDSLGGTIEVDSQQGKGTEITVRLHLSPVANEPSAGGDDILQSVVQRTRGRLLVLLDGDSESPAAEHQDRRLEHVLKETCATWFDLKVARDGDEDASDPDLFLYSEPPSVSALERRFRPSGDMTPRDREVPIVLVCLNAKDAVQISQKQTRVLTSLSKIVEVIPQPCGPRKLAKVFNQVFQMVDETARARGTVGGGALAYPRPQISRSEKPLSAEEADRSGLAETLEVGPSATSGRPSAMLGLASPPPLDPGTPAFDAGPSSPPAAEEVPQSTARHVLLVDDNKINLQLLVMFMKKCGFSYAEAENGQEALDRYTDACIPPSQSTGPGRRRFDFVLMDISMPVMDGLESTRRIREFERENEIAPANIIALTGLASADAQRDTQLAGIDVFIPKPVRFAKLRKLLSPV